MQGRETGSGQLAHQRKQMSEPKMKAEKNRVRLLRNLEVISLKTKPLQKKVREF